MRAHITARALELFLEEGYVAISMRRLASEAGCTPMTLYKYFDSKFAILQMLWGEVLGALFDRLERIAAREAAADRRLEAIACAYVEFWLEHRDHYFLVFLSGGVSQDDVTQFLGEASVLARFDIFRAGLAAALAGRRVAADELRVRSEALLCGLNGVAQALVTMSRYPWTPPRALVKRIVAGALAT